MSGETQSNMGKSNAREGENIEVYGKDPTSEGLNITIWY